MFMQPDQYGILNHFWSLAVEEQFYLFWPFVILLLKKNRYLLIFMISLLLLVLSIRLAIWDQKIEGLPYYNIFTFSRIDGICIGSIVAILQKMNPMFLSKQTVWIVMGLACINLLFDFINQAYHYSFPYLALIGYTTFGMIFGILIHEGTLGNATWVKNIFSTPILIFFGKISYGLYVFHWPIYVLLKTWLHKQVGIDGGNYSGFIVSLILSLLAVLLSIASYYFFEKRFLSLKRYLD
jgi:peptidoglycan/LPS O-acetylase OafA/YrhL